MKVELEFWSSQCPKGNGLKNLNWHGRLARSQKFSHNIRISQNLLRQKHLMAFWQGLLACLAIRWNRAKVFLTCSQLSCNGHKSDNKVYLLLDHCIVGEDPSPPTKIYLWNSHLVARSLFFVCTKYEGITKACKFLCIPSNFYRPPYLIQPQNIAQTSQRSNSVLFIL